MKLSEFKKLIRKGIMEELNEDENIQTGNSDVGLRNLYADNVNEASLKPEDIQRKYNEMFGKNPSTKFADVAKALGRPEEEVTMAFMGVNLPKLEEAEEDNVYGSFDSEQWYNKKTNTPFKGNFADFDEEEFDEFESMMKKYGDNRWFGKGESGKILFDMYKNKYGPMKVRTAKLEEAEEEEITITTPDSAEVEDIAAAEMSPEMDMAPSFGEEPTYTEEEAALMDDLDNGLKKAQELGDEKLSTLIGNIITYFTRQHVVKEGEAGRKKHYRGAVKDDKDQISKLKKDMKFDKKQLQKESLEILKMKKLAGLLKEGEYAKALLRENEYADWTEADCMTLPPEQIQYCIDYLSQYDPHRYMEAMGKENMSVNENRATLEQFRDYFKIMIKYQPDDVLALIMDLLANDGKNFDEWTRNIADDVLDTLN
jgi:hypothetical protein